MGKMVWFDIEFGWRNQINVWANRIVFVPV